MTKHSTILFSAALAALLALFAIALSAVVGARLANAAAGDIYNLGTFGGHYSAGYDVNDAGQVVGYAQDAAGRSRAFLWDISRGVTDLGTVNGTEAYAYAINASGSVAGGKDDNGTGVYHAFAWTPNEPHGTTGTMTNLAVQQEDYSFAVDINAAGQVVGYSISTYFVNDGSCTPDYDNYPNCGTNHWVTERSAVLWENGVGSDLTNSSADDWAQAINNAGQVAGHFYLDNNVDGHAFRYDGTPGSGVRHDLGTLGGSSSGGSAINDAGQVVGGSNTTGDAAHHAFRYIGTPGAGGVMVDLGTLGGASSVALDINDAGFVVGVANRAAVAGDGYWATLWRSDAGNTAFDLDAWLDAVNPTLGAYWKLESAGGINNNGLITGSGIYDDGPGGLTDGSRAFVLDASSLLSAIPGDYSGNGTVGPEDYDVWKTNFGSTTILAADGNGNHIIDAADFTVWLDNLGATLGSGSGSAGYPLGAPAALRSPAIPEPTSLALAIGGLLGLFAIARRPHQDVQNS